MFQTGVYVHVRVRVCFPSLHSRVSGATGEHNG